MTTLLSADMGLPCGWCHLYWKGGNGATDGYTVTSSKVQIYQLSWDPDNQTPGDAAGRTAMASHAVSEDTTTPISNFAACFACHGATAATYANSKQVTPFHGFGVPYTGDDGTAVQDTNQIQIYSGPTNPSADGPIHDESRHPGWEALNTLGAFVPLNKGVGKGHYGGTSGANYYNADNANHRDSEATYQDMIEFPWDNYSGGATVGTPVDITNFDLGGVQGTDTVPFAVPEIPLALP